LSSFLFAASPQIVGSFASALDAVNENEHFVKVTSISVHAV
jgi:hypothetical protein